MHIFPHAEHKVCTMCKCALCRLCRLCADFIDLVQQNPRLTRFGAPAVPTLCGRMRPYSADLETLPESARFQKVSLTAARERAPWRRKNEVLSLRGHEVLSLRTMLRILIARGGVHYRACGRHDHPTMMCCK